MTMSQWRKKEWFKRSAKELFGPIFQKVIVSVYQLLDTIGYAIF